MRIGWVASLSLIAILVVIAWLFVPWANVSIWAAEQQRAFQNAMARALLAVQQGEPRAIWTLCLATFAYGLVHAIGPGHGKVLLGGAALASGATFRRLTVLTVLSSLAQAGTAILLVAGIASVFELRSKSLVALTEDWLAPASYVLIAGIGGILILRGARAAFRRNVKKDEACGCGHHHGPELSAVERPLSLRDAAAIIVSIAIRPCTGALFVLAIAARFEVFLVGCLAVLSMGLGTAAFNLTVASSGFAMRSLAAAGSGHSADAMRLVSATMQMVGGTLILVLSAMLLFP